jgi:hypothetical protein
MQNKNASKTTPAIVPTTTDTREQELLTELLQEVTGGGGATCFNPAVEGLEESER